MVSVAMKQLLSAEGWDVYLAGRKLDSGRNGALRQRGGTRIEQRPTVRACEPAPVSSGGF